jgi:electron transfer flavoprotein beta subunit
MRVIVPVKRIAALDDDFELEGGRVDPDFVEHELNDWDRFSLQAALELKGEDGEVVVVTAGPDDAEEVLLTCLALGADRAVHAVVEEDDGDPLATARVLAAVVEREAADLILCGAQSSDAVNGATGVALAARLGHPRVAVVNRIAAADGGLEVQRELEGGVVELLRVPLPAVITVQTGANEPGYATLRAIKQAREKPLERLEPAELGLDDGAFAAARGARATSLTAPEAGSRAEMLEGGPPEIAERIAEIIRGAS